MQIRKMPTDMRNQSAEGEMKRGKIVSDDD